MYLVVFTEFQIKMAKVFLSFFGKPPFYVLQHYMQGFKPALKINRGIPINIINSEEIFLTKHRQFSSHSEDRGKSLQAQSKSDISEEVKPITLNTVKETTKTVSYLGVIVVGVGITGFIFYSIFSELFSSKSPNNVYSKALETVTSDVRVQDALGQPISGYGEENRRGRRQHVR